jgi:hypothetical protein
MVHASVLNPLPREFQDGMRMHDYVWAPAHYEQFVDRCPDQIRAELGRADMTRDEMLSALVGMAFEKYVQLNRKHVSDD